MSSALRLLVDHPQLFQWDAALDPAAYIEARYTVASHLDGEATAVAMAMEQSAAITAIRGYVAPGDAMRESTVRVRAVEAIESPAVSEVVAYDVDDTVAATWRITLAIPLRLLPAKPTQLLNGVVGDLPRYGFITRFRLDDLAFPDAARRSTRKSNAARKRGWARNRPTRLRWPKRDCSSQISCIGSEKRLGSAIVDAWCKVTRSAARRCASARARKSWARIWRVSWTRRGPRGACCVPIRPITRPMSPNRRPLRGR